LPNPEEKTMPDNQSGYAFATAGIEHIMTCAQGFCDNQEQYLKAANQPEITALRARGSWLHTKGRELREQLAQAMRADRDRRASGSRAWNLSIATTLAVAAFFFALMTFEPFHLGWKPYLYCGGFAVLGLFALDYFLTQWCHPNVARAASIVLLVAIPTIVVLAVIRGDVFAHELNNVEAPVVVDGATSQAPPPDDTADHAVLLLRFAMALAALGFEIAGGIATHEFRKTQQEIDDDLAPKIRRDLENIAAELLGVIHRIAELESQPAAYRAMFWRDFYRGLITNASRGAALRGLLVAAVLACASVQNLRAAENLHVVIPLDLSQTETARDFAGHTEFDQNTLAISTVLGTLPPGSRATVLGVTGESFMTPYSLLSTRFPEDPGPFSGALINARRTVVGAWTKRAQTLSPSFLRTDLLGASVYAGQIFLATPASHKVLAVFSDMRHQAHGLDLETPKRIDVAKALAYVQENGLLAPLSGADVYIFGAGAHGGDKDAAYWTALKTFWMEYFRRSGATVKWFSPGRERDALIRVTAPPAESQR
jgi:hypothetical protein